MSDTPLSLNELAEKFQIDANKPFFPVNSLRLLYFILNDAYTQGSQQTAAQITAAILQVEAILQARIDHRANTANSNTQSDFEVALPLLESLYKIVDSPAIRDIFAEQFTYLNPLQDEFFLTSYQEIMAQEKLSVGHLTLLLRIRAMDSLIFSTVLSEIWRQNQANTSSAPTLSASLPSLHHHFHLAYQINDLVDTVVFARDDMTAGHFSPFKVIQKIAPEPAAAKELITNMLSDLIAQTQLFAFPEPLQAQVQQFYRELVGVVMPTGE